MLTVTLPSPEMVALFGPVPQGVNVIAWDVSTDAASPADIDAVLVPPYFFADGGFARIRALPNLRLVQLPSAGYEHALPRLTPGVPVANGRGVHDGETAELAIGLALASLRGIDDAVRDRTDHAWNPILRPSLADRRVLLIGYGSIGKALATRLDTFEVDLTVVARTARTEGDRVVHAFTELAALAANADLVIAIVPLTDETRHLLDAALLAALPDGALVVNVARGGIVDTDALVAELASGRLHAALDVTDPEPLPTGHPLWSTPNTILTPHVGGYTTATDARIIALMRRQVDALLWGNELENVVN
ncbi:2-hydroxyacid dehydrogenase [soil metagenome]